MAHLSKLDQSVAVELGFKPTNERVVKIAKAHATKSGVDTKSPDFLEHVRKNKTQILEPTTAQNNPDLPVETQSYADETAPTPTQSNSIELREQVRPKRGRNTVEKNRREDTTRFIVTPKGSKAIRIYLEPTFVDALNYVAKIDENSSREKDPPREFLRHYALVGASKNPSSNIREVIVSKLLARVQP